MVAATTACGISYQFSSTVTGNTAEIDFEVAAYFYPDKSWYRPETANEGILGHEQLHFDITELFAREMRYRLAQTKFTGNVKAEVKAIYSQVNQDLTQFQERYDRETNFSRDSVQQKKWNNMIAEKLTSKGF